MKQVDAIVILGHYCDSKGTISRRQRTRVLKAVRLLDKYPNAKIITTGGKEGVFNRSSTPLAQWVKLYLQQLGVPSRKILLEGRSMNTAQQARYVKELAKNRRLTSLVIVTSFPHILKAKYLFGNAFEGGFDLRYVISDYWSGVIWTFWDYLWELAGWLKILLRRFLRVR